MMCAYTLPSSPTGTPRPPCCSASSSAKAAECATAPSPTSAPGHRKRSRPCGRCWKGTGRPSCHCPRPSRLPARLPRSRRSPR